LGEGGVAKLEWVRVISEFLGAADTFDEDFVT
jgi:hypothetical protein